MRDVGEAAQLQELSNQRLAAIEAALDLMHQKGLLPPSASEVLASNGQTKAESAMAWGRNALKDAGLIKADSPRGLWELTKEGLARTPQQPRGTQLAHERCDERSRNRRAVGSRIHDSKQTLRFDRCRLVAGVSVALCVPRDRARSGHRERGVVRDARRDQAEK